MNTKVIGKSFLLVIVGILIFLMMNTNCLARILTFDEVSDEFFNVSTIEEIVSASSDTYNLENNSSARTWDLYRNGDILFSFVYDQDNISYESQSYEESLNSLAGIWIVGMIEAIFNLSGVDINNVSEDDLTSTNYESGGLSYVIENYNSVGSEDGSSWNVDVDYVSSFKMSLDTEIISNYFNSNSTTPNEDSNTTDINDQNQIENPDTGVFGPTVILIVLLISSVLLVIYANKKSKMKRI